MIGHVLEQPECFEGRAESTGIGKEIKGKNYFRNFHVDEKRILENIAVESSDNLDHGCSFGKLFDQFGPPKKFSDVEPDGGIQALHVPAMAGQNATPPQFLQ